MPNPGAGEGVATEDSQNTGSGEDRASRARFPGWANTFGSRSSSSSPLGARSSSSWSDEDAYASSDDVVCYDCKSSVSFRLYDKDERTICYSCGLKRKLHRKPNPTASEQSESGSGLRTDTRSPGHRGSAELLESAQQEKSRAVESSALWDAASSSHTTALSMASLAKQKLARFFLEVSDDDLAYGDENSSFDWGGEQGTEIVRSNASTPAPLPSPFEVSDGGESDVEARDVTSETVRVVTAAAKTES